MRHRLGRMGPRPAASPAAGGAGPRVHRRGGRGGCRRPAGSRRAPGWSAGPGSPAAAANGAPRAGPTCAPATRPSACTGTAGWPSTCSPRRRSAGRCRTASTTPARPWPSRWPSRCTPPGAAGSGRARSCAVIGAGGIGAFIVAAAAALGAAPLIAVDVADGRLDTAAALGATHTVNADRRRRGPARSRPPPGSDGAHVVIEASGAPASPAAALAHGPPGRRCGDRGAAGRTRSVSICSRCPPGRWTLHGTLAHVCGEDLAEAVVGAGRHGAGARPCWAT